jgi:cystathionine gamma-synthase
VFIIDDTLASFGNVDILSQGDMLLTSLTKSFSGKSDVLGGSIVLNPLSPHYAELSKRFTETYRNQLFAVDAAVLLSNSQDYYERTSQLNANAQTIADFLHKSIGQPDSPVINVQHTMMPLCAVVRPSFQTRDTDAS